MAIDAPAHRLINFAPHSMRLAHFAVAARALNSSPKMGLVSEKNVGVLFKPVDSPPRRLFAPFRKSRQLLNLCALGFDRGMADHA